MSDLVGTPAQVAQQLECCEAKVWELIDRGHMPHVRLGDRKVVIMWAELEQWLRDESRASTLLAELEADGVDILKNDRQGAA